MTGAVVLATNQGLGYLAKDYYDHGVFDKVLIKPHSSRENNTWWYRKWKWLVSENYDWFFEGLDSVLYFEEPFDWKLLLEARKRGIKNVFMPMYECTRDPFPYEPDLIIAPSLLDYEVYKNKNTVFLPVPVEVEWKLRETAKVFVHNAGNGGLAGRNGTVELLEAMKYVKSPIKLIVRMQEKNYQSTDPRVEIRKGTVPFKELYAEGDVFIFPEKFNGLSLPLQEACASGMLVMATNRFPMNKWLPIKPLIPVTGYRMERVAREIEVAQISPQDIAAKIDEWYGKDITRYSLAGKKWAEQMSWQVLKNKICEKLKK